MRPRRGAFDFVYDGIESVFGRIGTTITVSADERRFAADRLRIPARRLRSIPNGIDTDRFRPASKGEKPVSYTHLRVLLNGREAFAQVIGGMHPAAARFDSVEELAPGDTIDFAVFPGVRGNADFDATEISATVAEQPKQ